MLREWVQSIVEAVIILLVLFVFLWPVSINGTSMQPSLENKDRVFISRFSVWTDSFGRGDIVVFDAEDFDENMVKRVIAVGGDYIEIADGNVYVNGEMLDEDYIAGSTYEDIKLNIDNDQIFVMGDNREKSTDSRYFGTVDRDDVFGKVIMRFFPLNKITIFE